MSTAEAMTTSDRIPEYSKSLLGSQPGITVQIQLFDPRVEAYKIIVLFDEAIQVPYFVHHSLPGRIGEEFKTGLENRTLEDESLIQYALELLFQGRRNGHAPFGIGLTLIYAIDHQDVTDLPALANQNYINFPTFPHKLPLCEKFWKTHGSMQRICLAKRRSRLSYICGFNLFCMQIEQKNSGSYSYLDEGQGHSLVLLHGLMGGLSNFEEVITYFSSNGYRVIMPVLPMYSLPLVKTNIKTWQNFWTDSSRTWNWRTSP